MPPRRGALAWALLAWQVRAFITAVAEAAWALSSQLSRRVQAWLALGVPWRSIDVDVRGDDGGSTMCVHTVHGPHHAPGVWRRSDPLHEVARALRSLSITRTPRCEGPLVALL
jgi:hypothetical protein